MCAWANSINVDVNPAKPNHNRQWNDAYNVTYLNQQAHCFNDWRHVEPGIVKTYRSARDLGMRTAENATFLRAFYDILRSLTTKEKRLITTNGMMWHWRSFLFSFPGLAGIRLLARPCWEPRMKGWSGSRTRSSQPWCRIDQLGSVGNALSSTSSFCAGIYCCLLL